MNENYDGRVKEQGVNDTVNEHAQRDSLNNNVVHNMIPYSGPRVNIMNQQDCKESRLKGDDDHHALNVICYDYQVFFVENATQRELKGV